MTIRATGFMLLISGIFNAKIDVNKIITVLSKIEKLNLFGINFLETMMLIIKTTKYAIMVAYAAPTIPKAGIKYIFKQILIILPMLKINIGYFVFSFNWKK